METATLSPTPSKTRTRPDYAREIWDNGFREESVRIAIALNKDKKRQVHTDKNFWFENYQAFLLKKYKRYSAMYGTYWAVRDGVWNLLWKHFDKPIKVHATQEMLDKHNRHTAILEAVGSASQKTVTKEKQKAPVAPMSERSGSTGKVAGSNPAGRSLPSGSVDISSQISEIKRKWSDYNRRFVEAGKLWGMKYGGTEFKTVRKFDFLPNDKSGVVLNCVEIDKAPNGKYSFGIWYDFNGAGGVHGSSVFDTVQYDSVQSAAVAGLQKYIKLCERHQKENKKARKCLELAQQKLEELCNDKKPLLPASGKPLASPKQPIAQLLFGNPDETASLIAFCDAQLQLLKPGHQLAAYYKAIKQRLTDPGGNDLKQNRYCGCGCGAVLTGNGKMKYIDGTHRKRAFDKNKAQ